MMLVDSHCHLDHLDLTPYDNKLDPVIEAARKNQVKHLLSVGLDLLQSRRVIEIASGYQNVSASVGVHPTENIPNELTEEELMQLADHPKVVAIGETGLDFYRAPDYTERQLQIRRFRTHIRAARILKKPLIIHTRQAREETLKILKEEKAEQASGVLHCFTENWEMAVKAIEMGFYISFSGIITFKNALALQEIAQKVPDENILIETDAPYLAPVPYRGKPNEPAYVRYVAEKMALLRESSLENIAAITTRNFFNLFSLANRSFYDSDDAAPFTK